MIYEYYEFVEFLLKLNYFICTCYNILLTEKLYSINLQNKFSRMFLLKLVRLQLLKHIKYAYKLPDGELLKISHRMVNRKIYKYAKNEYRQKIQNKYRQI